MPRRKRTATGDPALKARVRPLWIAAGALATAIGTVAGFTDHLSKLRAFWSETFGQRPAPLTVVIDHAEGLRVAFSVLNTSRHHFQIVSIEQRSLSGIDLCSSCSTQHRAPLQLVLTPAGQVRRAFGTDKVHNLAPGEAAPFKLEVSSLEYEGGAYVLTVTANEVEAGRTTQLTVPYLLFVVGPADFPKPAIVVSSFADWPKLKNHRLRAIAARALGELKGEQVRASLFSVAAKDPEIDVRAAAIDGLSHYDGDDVFHFLLAELKKRSGDSSLADVRDRGMTRKVAARALGERRDVRAVPALVDTWRNDNGFQVADSAVGALGRIGGSAGHAAVLQILNDFEAGRYRSKDRHNGDLIRGRSAIIGALGLLGGRAALEMLERETYRSSPEWDATFARTAAVEGLARHPDPRVLAFLTGVSRNHSEERVRTAAVEALARRGSPEVLALLEDVVRRDSAESVRVAAVEGLAKSDAREVIALLTNVARSDSAKDVRIAALKALARHNSPQIVEFIATVGLADPVEEVRWEAVEALGRHDLPEVIARIRNIVLADPKERVRIAAVKALAQHQSREVVEFLVNVARVASLEEVRIAAVEVLAGDGSPDVVTIIARIARADSRERVRSAAVEALAHHPSLEVNRVLEGVARSDSAVRVRMDAVAALGRQETPEIIEFLKDMARADSEEVRAAAARALARNTSPQVVELLMNLGRDDPAEVVRAASIRALASHDSPPVIALLTSVVFTDSARWVRITAVNVLAERGTPPVVEVLRKVARADADELVRDAARDAVEELSAEAR